MSTEKEIVEVRVTVRDVLRGRGPHALAALLTEAARFAQNEFQWASSDFTDEALDAFDNAELEA